MGLYLGPGFVDRKNAIGGMAKLVTESIKGARGIAKPRGDLLNRQLLNEIGTEGLILALARRSWLEKELGLLLRARLLNSFNFLGLVL